MQSSNAELIVGHAFALSSGLQLFDAVGDQLYLQRGGRWVHALDANTLAQRIAQPVPTPWLRRGEVAAVAGTGIPNVQEPNAPPPRGTTKAWRLTDLEPVWSAAGTLLAVSEAGFLLAREEPDTGSLSLAHVDGATGRELARIPLDAERAHVEALCVGDAVVVRVTDQLVGVDLREARVRWRRRCPVGAALLAAAGRGWVLELLDDGFRTRTRWSRLDFATGEVTPEAELDGRTQSALQLGSTRLVRNERDWQVLHPRCPDGAERFDAGPAHGDETAIALGTQRALTVLREADGGLDVLRMPLPDGRVLGVAVVSNVAFAQVDERIFRVELGSIAPRAGLRVLDAAWTASEPTGEGEGEASVIFSGEGMVLVNHPTLGRLTCRRGPDDPRPAVGETVVIERVDRTVPSITKVMRWRAASAEQAAPDSVHLSAATVPPPFSSEPAVAPARATPAQLPVLEELARQKGFPVDPLLVRVVKLWDVDPHGREWLDRLGFQINVLDVGDEDIEDPRFLPLAWDGGGNLFGLRLGELGDGGFPELWFWDHEVDETERLAPSFARCFADLLHRAADRRNPPLTDLLLRALDLPASFPSPLPRS